MTTVWSTLTKEQKKRRLTFYGVIVAILIVLVLLTVWSLPYFQALSTVEGQAAFQARVDKFGPWGVLVVLFLQVIQVVIAFIPGEIIQVLCGVMYGSWWGLVLCLVGCGIAEAIVFALVRRFGEPLVRKVFGKKTLDKYRFIHDAEKAERLVFILFFIPGLPKDLLTYVAPLSKIKMRDFLVISLVARTPGMIASVIVGSSAATGDWGRAAVIIILAGVIGALGLLLREKITDRLHKRKELPGT